MHKGFIILERVSDWQSWGACMTEVITHLASSRVQSSSGTFACDMHVLLILTCLHAHPCHCMLVLSPYSDSPQKFGSNGGLACDMHDVLQSLTLHGLTDDMHSDFIVT